MQNNTTTLTKQAVAAALKGNWEAAIELNERILEFLPNNIDTKMRLGKAYLQTGQFTRAKKLFKEVLEVDPINTIAQKNCNLAKEKINVETTTQPDPKTLIIEPGTVTEVVISHHLSEKQLAKLSNGEPLEVKIVSDGISFLKNGKIIGETAEHRLVQAMKRAKKLHSRVSAHFVSAKNGNIVVLIRSSIPVFRAEKQAIKPYLKKGTIKEPELEIPLGEEEEDTTAPESE